MSPSSHVGDAASCRRYFEGVQGDKSKQGELFGIKNIFKLHEHTLATKMAVRCVLSLMLAISLTGCIRSRVPMSATLTGRSLIWAEGASVQRTAKLVYSGCMRRKRKRARNTSVFAG